MKTVTITNLTGLPQNTKISDTETGEEFQGVTKVNIEIVPRVPVKATLVVELATFMIEGEGTVELKDPRDGIYRKVKRIEFEDSVEPLVFE